MNTKEFNYVYYNHQDELFEIIPSEETIPASCELTSTSEFFKNVEEFMFDENDIGTLLVMQGLHDWEFVILKIQEDLTFKKVY